MNTSFSGDRNLRVPGPVPVPPSVARAASRPMLWHRSAEFVALFQQTEAALQKVFATRSDVLIMAGSGTAGMESAVANMLDPGEKALIFSGGKFGERWIELAEAFGARPAVVTYPYGQSIDLDRAASAIDEHPDARVVFATHNESSTAVLNDVEGLARIVKERGRLLVVDAVSSLGGTPLAMDDWGVDVVVAGSQKCLMIPPGLAFVGVSAAAWEKAKEAKNPRYYLDWAQYKKAAVGAQSPYTSAVSLMYALHEALVLLEAEGADARFDRHRLMQAMIRGGLGALGFSMFVDDHAASPTLTAAGGGDVDVEKLRQTVADLGVIISGGQGDLKGRIFRIGHMGSATPLDMISTLGAVELGLARLGVPVTFGRGTGRAMEVWQSWR